MQSVYLGLSLSTTALTPALVAPSLTPALVAPSARRAPPPTAKFVGAALAAAFAAKDDDTPPPEEELTLAEMEAKVIDSIREGLDAGIGKPRRAFGALGDFGKASGTLAATWLTPQQVEKVVAFWGCGGTLIARDMRHGGLPRLQDLQSSGLFSLLAINTFPWTPLLLPLVARAVNTTEGIRPSFVPPAFDDTRLAALRRLRGDAGLAEGIDTPQTIDEGVAFFTDGSRMLVRDVRRARLTAYGDSLGAYAWFLLLTFSTFPLTPLLIPVIDKRRDGMQSDYVPAAFRARRLAAFARLKKSSLAAPRAPAEVIAAAATGAPDERPAPAELLEAIVALPGTPAGREHYLEALAGGGAPGRKWRLMYTAGTAAVKSARQARKKRGSGAPSWLEGVGDTLLPWTRLRHGLYLDEYITAVQRFDASCFENENGIYALGGSDFARFSVKGPFKWPDADKRTVCAFQPTVARCQLGEWVWEFPMDASDDATAALWSTQPKEAPPLFDDAPVTKLPFFKFLQVDESVAVAQGRSGGVAVWVRCE